MHLDGRRLVDAQEQEIIEITLLYTPVHQRDRLTQGFAYSIERGSLDLTLCAGWIDDVAAHIAGHPHPVHGDPAAGRHGCLHDFRKIAEMAVVEGDALPRSLGPGAFAPCRFF